MTDRNTLLTIITDTTPISYDSNGFHIKLITKAIQNVEHSGHNNGPLIYGIFATLVLTGKKTLLMFHMELNAIEMITNRITSANISTPLWIYYTIILPA